MTFGRAGLVRPIRPLVVLAVVALALVIGTAVRRRRGGRRASPASAARGRSATPRASPARPAPTASMATADGQLDMVEARSPRVSRGIAVRRPDGQWVGIRILFQRSKPGRWHRRLADGQVDRLRSRSSPMTTRRSPSAGAAGRLDYTGTPQFRVRANIRWYKPGTTSVVQGAATLAYEWYDTGGGEPRDGSMPAEP